MRQGRGELFAEQAQWEDAAADFMKAAELKPDFFRPWYFSALAQLAADDTEGYRETCAAILEQFAETEDVNSAHFASWSCVLAGDVVNDFARLQPYEVKLLATNSRYESSRTAGRNYPAN